MVATPMPSQAPHYSVASYRSLESFLLRMHQIGTAFTVDLDAQLAPLGITSTQWGLLKAIADGRGDTAADLSRQYGYDPGALTRILDRLERKGLVRRDRSQKDRRRVHIALTEAGRELTQGCLPYLVDAHNALLEGFSPEEFQGLMAYLSRILDNARDGPGRRRAAREGMQ